MLLKKALGLNGDSENDESMSGSEDMMTALEKTKCRLRRRKAHSAGAAVVEELVWYFRICK